MTDPLVSVVIPSYNAARFLPQALDSVFAQTFTDYEVIVVDDESQDETPAVVARYGSRLRYLRARLGSANATRNAGILASRGRYIALLDADDWWLPHKLEAQVDFAEQCPRAGLVYARCLVVEEASGATLGELPAPPYPTGRVLQQLYFRQFVPSPTPLIRREVLERVGLFDPAERGADDWEMWLRVAAATDFAFLNQVVACYRVHASSSGRRPAGAYLRDLRRMFVRAGRTYPELRPLLPARLFAFEATYGAVAWERGENTLARACFRRALRLRPWRIDLLARLALTVIPAAGRHARLEQAHGYYRNGKYSFATGERARARREFAAALCTWPFGWRLFGAALALTFLPPALSQRLLAGRSWQLTAQGPRPALRSTLRQW